MQFLFVSFSIVVYPMAQHQFYVNAIKRLFFARTEENDLLLPRKKNGMSTFETKISKFIDPVNIPVNTSRKMQKEIQKH